MKWDEEQLETLDHLAEPDKGGALTWDVIAIRMNGWFATNRTSEACRKRWVRYTDKMQRAHTLNQRGIGQ